MTDARGTSPATAPLRILGMDPGLNHTGWAVVEASGGTERFVACGVIDVPDGELAFRLGVITSRLTELIETHRPTVCSAERVFVNINPQSTLRLGQARGAALVAAALKGLRVEEFTPSEIKQAVTGSGKADKAQIQQMMALLFGLETLPRTDAADALACALCCSHTLKLRALERSGATARTYATARRGASSRGARAAWTQLLQKGTRS